MENYLFQAAPKPVQTRTKKNIYREPDEHKESLQKTHNLMYDRRVSRGSTYAPSKRTHAPNAAGPFRPVQPVAKTPQPQPAALRSAQDQHPLPPSSAAPPDYAMDVDFIRIATPEPVAGRVHSTVQTDTYLEDLRRNKQASEHDFATQTDPENDRPTAPLFVPRSSGDDVATEIEPDALFDFELEVQAVLGVLCEKSLEQALMEVCEEEELAELAQHQAAFQQEKDLALVNVQQLVQRDERRKAERERRRLQEEERLAKEKALADKRRAATMAKNLVASMESSILTRLDEAGAFYDPVKKEVETLFMPHLLGRTATKLEEYRQACAALDDIMLDSLTAYQSSAAQAALDADEQEVRDLVAHLLDPQNVPRPVQRVMSLVHKVGREEEKTARAAHGASALAAAAAASSSPALSPEQRARAIVEGILAERAAVLAAETKRMRDIITIQSLQRGRRDRARVAVLADKRRREAERAAMSPQELLISLRTSLGCEVRVQSASGAAAPVVSDEQKDDSAAPSAASIAVFNLSALGPASQAGLVAGDCILALNGAALTSADDLSSSSLKALSLNPGDSVQLQVRRTTDGRVENVPLELSTDEEGYDHAAVRALREEAELPLPTVPFTTPEEAAEALTALPAKLGATPVALEQSKGARLSKVAADSAAARCGLADGDVVVSINGVSVGDHKALAHAVKERQAGDILELALLTPDSLEKVNAGAPITRSMATHIKSVELGGGGKKSSLEQVRRLRRIAGLPVFGEQ